MKEYGSNLKDRLFQFYQQSFSNLKLQLILSAEADRRCGNFPIQRFFTLTLVMKAARGTRSSLTDELNYANYSRKLLAGARSSLTEDCNILI